MTDCYITLAGGHAIAVMNAHGSQACSFSRVRACAGDRIINTLKSSPKPVAIADRAGKVEICNLGADGKPASKH